MTSLPQLKAPTLADQAYDAIRQAIVSGDLARGTQVTERGLAEALNISPTPVREALRRLTQDRLIERVGPRTLRVAEFTGTDLAEIGLIEDILRALAARLAATKASAVQLAEMERILADADAARSRLLNQKGHANNGREATETIWKLLQEFHRLVDAASNNPTLIHILGMLDAFDTDQRRQALFAEIETNARSVDSRYKQHRAIFEAIRRRDPAKAERLMLEHSHTGSRAATRIDRTVSR